MWTFAFNHQKVLKTKNPLGWVGFGGASSPEASGEPGTDYDFLLDKISFKMDGSAMSLVLKILLFILLMKFSR